MNNNFNTPFFQSEQEFFDIVRQMSDIGYGRMMQIISFEWHNKDPIGCFDTGQCVGMLSKKDQKEYVAIKKSDPLFNL